MASLDDCLSILYNGYIKGGGGFEILKGGGAMTTREVRIGVSQVYNISAYVILTYVYNIRNICNCTYVV